MINQSSNLILLKKVALFDLIITSLIAIIGGIFVFFMIKMIGVKYDNSTIGNFLNQNAFAAGQITILYFFVMNLIYIFYFKDWHRLTFSIIALILASLLMLISVSFSFQANWEEILDSKQILAMLFGLFSSITYPVFHYIMTLKTYFRKN